VQHTAGEKVEKRHARAGSAEKLAAV
jgi:hypothetical protein